MPIRIGLIDDQTLVRKGIRGLLELSLDVVDLAAEQWARSVPGGFSYLGTGQEIGPVLFEADREHRLLLWVTDRHGAEGRKLCHFQVVQS